MARIRKTDYYLNIDLYSTSLAHVKEQVDRLIEEYGDDALLSYSGDDVEFTLQHWYEETPEEEAARLKREAEQKVQSEKWQRQQYEALKKKFEGQSANEGQ